MKKGDVICSGILMAYAISAFLTFGWIYDTHPHSDGAGALIGGIFWPVYWPGSAAIDAIHWMRLPPSDCFVDGVAYQPDRDGVCRVNTKRG